MMLTHTNRLMVVMSILSVTGQTGVQMWGSVFVFVFVFGSRGVQALGSVCLETMSIGNGAV